MAIKNNQKTSFEVTFEEPYKTEIKEIAEKYDYTKAEVVETLVKNTLDQEALDINL